MIRIPLAATPSQTLSIVLAGQLAQIELRQVGANMYFSLGDDAGAVVTSRICRDRQRLLRDARYRGFAGDFAFVDTQGGMQPAFAGLDTRYMLLYLEVGE